MVWCHYSYSIKSDSYHWIYRWKDNANQFASFFRIYYSWFLRIVCTHRGKKIRRYYLLFIIILSHIYVYQSIAVLANGKLLWWRPSQHICSWLWFCWHISKIVLKLSQKNFIVNHTSSIKVLKASRGSNLFWPKQKKKNIYHILSCGRIDFYVSAYWWNMILNCALQHHILWLPRKKNILNKCAVADDDLKCHMTFKLCLKKKRNNERRKSEKNKREPTNNDWSLRLKTHWLNRILKQMFSI